MPPGRTDRCHTGDRPTDQRRAFARDRDRILYTSAFRRLAGVTQVAHAGEGHVFHNRLTHTLEVGQIARRLAEYRRDEQPALCDALGVDPEVAEAAAFAHDLGHPPFGHIGEEELNARVIGAGDEEGFEGNAQSFRTVALLSVRHSEIPGLNLTRATLNAILKYPWFRQIDKGTKFGAYLSESREFQFAREAYGGSQARSAEAEIMDWADDIAYAVHDLEDFYRAGLIPLDRLLDGGAEIERFLGGVFERWNRPSQGEAEGELADTFRTFIDGLTPPDDLLAPYSGSLAQRAALRSLTSVLINRYIVGTDEGPAFELVDPASNNGVAVSIKPVARRELAMLKRLTWEYVIYNPRLASQQAGQRRIIRTLFDEFCRSASTDRVLLSPAMADLYARGLAADDVSDDHLAARIAADSICRMTEDEALRMFHRLTGLNPGSILEGIGR